MLAEAEEMGLAMTRAGQATGPVLVSREPVRLTVQAQRQGADIVMTPALAAGNEVIGRDNHVLIGSPTHGVIWWDARNALRLAPLAPGTDPAATIKAQPVRVPAAQEERFLRHVYPRLSARMPVMPDDSVELPEVGRSRLALGVRDILGYEYDLGDSWEHEIRLEQLVPADPNGRYPTCVAGEGACPPEHCGGTPGYQDLIDTLADPDHPDHEDMLRWLGIDKGSDFDPTRFDLADANRRLEAVVRGTFSTA